MSSPELKKGSRKCIPHAGTVYCIYGINEFTVLRYKTPMQPIQLGKQQAALDAFLLF